MSKKLSAKAKGLITRFQLTTAEKTERGSQHPDDWVRIDRAFARAKTRLEAYLLELESKT